MCILWVIFASGFLLEICAMEHVLSLSELKILQTDRVHGLKTDLPLERHLRIDFLMQGMSKNAECALIEIYSYRIKNAEDRNKMISSFGKDYAIFFDKRPGAPLVHLRDFEIYNDKHKNSGLGKQLFLYTLITMQNRYPEGIYFWKAVAFDGQRKKESLFRFYKNFGAKLMHECETSALFYIDLAKLNLGLFKPKREMSKFLAVESKLL